MMFHRPGRLRAVLFCAAILSSVALLKGAPQASPQQPPPQETGRNSRLRRRPNSNRRRRRPNPFETVPVTPAQPPAAASASQPRPRKAPVNVLPGQPPQDIIESIEFRGARRVRQDTLQALIFSKKGDKYDEETLHRDFMALWNTGRFDDIRIEREPGKEGWIVRFVVVERPVVRSINYDGNKSMTVSDILDRFKERKVGLVVESQYDPNKIQRAKNVLARLAGRARPSVRQGRPADPARSAFVARDHLQDRRRPQGQSGQHRDRGKHGLQRIAK